MKKQRMPRGWSKKRIRNLAAHHDQQTDAQQAAEIEAALADQQEQRSVLRYSMQNAAKVARKNRY